MHLKFSFEKLNTKILFFRSPADLIRRKFTLCVALGLESSIQPVMELWLPSLLCVSLFTFIALSFQVFPIRRRRGG